MHHTFVNRFYREIFLRRELQPRFDDELLTCSGLISGFYKAARALNNERSHFRPEPISRPTYLASQTF
jgi:hypothetical protein